MPVGGCGNMNAASLCISIIILIIVIVLIIMVIYNYNNGGNCQNDSSPIIQNPELAAIIARERRVNGGKGLLPNTPPSPFFPPRS
jgi:uncharacterized membrane protein